MTAPVLIIAEAGVNHNGSILLAKQLIDVAASAGADVVKFQTFKTENLVTETAQKASYQKRSTEGESTQFDMLKQLELSEEVHLELQAYCVLKKIQFLSTPFDLDSIDFLEKLDMPLFKIPSGEITNLPYLRKIGGLKKRIILSTGMSTLEEIEAALSVLTGAGTPKSYITLLHCTSEYPAPFSGINLRAMCTLKKEFNVDVGYSDHTLGIEAGIAAVALGATVLEKHFTLDKTLPGPDHQASLDPSELKQLVSAVRNISMGLGTGHKEITSSEEKNKIIVRKSIVASKTIQKGDIFSENNITTKRPGNGLSPFLWDTLIGKSSEETFQKDDLIYGY